VEKTKDGREYMYGTHVGGHPGQVAEAGRVGEVCKGLGVELARVIRLGEVGVGLAVSGERRRVLDHDGLLPGPRRRAGKAGAHKGEGDFGAPLVDCADVHKEAEPCSSEGREAVHVGVLKRDVARTGTGDVARTGSEGDASTTRSGGRGRRRGRRSRGHKCNDGAHFLCRRRKAREKARGRKKKKVRRY
jgi:hypothetical protein